MSGSARSARQSCTDISGLEVEALLGSDRTMGYLRARARARACACMWSARTILRGEGDCGQGASNPMAKNCGKLRENCGAITKTPEASRSNTSAQGTHRATKKKTRKADKRKAIAEKLRKIVENCEKLRNCKNSSPPPPCIKEGPPPPALKRDTTPPWVSEISAHMGLSAIRSLAVKPPESPDP